MSTSDPPAAAWREDPGGAHELRYWDGSTWTDHVADQGRQATDPLRAPESAGSEGLPAPPAPPTAAPPFAGAPQLMPSAPVWRRLGGLRTALTVLLWCAVGTSILLLIALITQRTAFEDVVSGDFSFEALDRLESADGFVGGMVALDFLLTIAIAVVFIVWLWRVAKNAEVLGRQNPRFGPGWTIGGWFIPLANFVIPLLVVRDLWRGSDPAVPPGDPNWRQGPGGVLVGWWWAAWLASGFAFQLTPSGETSSSPTDFRVSSTVSLVSTAISVASAILAIYLVRRLTARQEACASAHLPDFASGQAAPSAQPYPQPY